MLRRIRTVSICTIRNVILAYYFTENTLRIWTKHSAEGIYGKNWEKSWPAAKNQLDNIYFHKYVTFLKRVPSPLTQIAEICRATTRCVTCNRASFTAVGCVSPILLEIMKKREKREGYLIKHLVNSQLKWRFTERGP